jgi:hypothetical protein
MSSFWVGGGSPVNIFIILRGASVAIVTLNLSLGVKTFLGW